MMTKNESQMDRAIRLLVGLVLLFIGYQTGAGWLMIVFYVLGIIALITAATGFCFLYKVLGLNTAQAEAKPEAAKPVEPETMAPVEPETETMPMTEETVEETAEEAEEEKEEAPASEPEMTPVEETAKEESTEATETEEENK